MTAAPETRTVTASPIPDPRAAHPETRRPRITALICTLNEEHHLPEVLLALPGWLDEVLIVDGHSTDGTERVARTLCPRARFVLQPGKGKGVAMRYGFREARGDIIVTLDADGTTDPVDLPRFIAPLLGPDGVDFVKGSRFKGILPRRKPLHRIIGNWIITLTFDVLFARPYTDLCSGYNAFWKGAIERVDLETDDWFQEEPRMHCRVRRAGLRVTEVAHEDRGRVHGESKQPAWKSGFGAWRTVVQERFRWA